MPPPPTAPQAIAAAPPHRHVFLALRAAGDRLYSPTSHKLGLRLALGHAKSR